MLAANFEASIGGFSSNGSVSGSSLRAAPLISDRRHNSEASAGVIVARTAPPEDGVASVARSDADSRVRMCQEASGRCKATDRSSSAM